jgi:hypothetical protein
MAIATCGPSAEPTVRTTVFMLAVTPASRALEPHKVRLMIATTPSPIPPPIGTSEHARPGTVVGSASSATTMASASGATPPPRPWSTRPAIKTPMSSVRAHRTEPAENASSDQRSTRRRPYRSPNGPASGTATTVASRKPVISHVTAVAEACNCT